MSVSDEGAADVRLVLTRGWACAQDQFGNLRRLMTPSGQCYKNTIMDTTPSAAAGHYGYVPCKTMRPITTDERPWNAVNTSDHLGLFQVQSSFSSPYWRKWNPGTCRKYNDDGRMTFEEGPHGLLRIKNFCLSVRGGFHGYNPKGTYDWKGFDDAGKLAVQFDLGKGRERVSATFKKPKLLLEPPNCFYDRALFLIPNLVTVDNFGHAFPRFASAPKFLTSPIFSSETKPGENEVRKDPLIVILDMVQRGWVQGWWPYQDLIGSGEFASILIAPSWDYDNNKPDPKLHHWNEMLAVAHYFKMANTIFNTTPPSKFFGGPSWFDNKVCFREAMMYHSCLHCNGSEPFELNMLGPRSSVDDALLEPMRQAAKRCWGVERNKQARTKGPAVGIVLRLKRRAIANMGLVLDPLRRWIESLGGTLRVLTFSETSVDKAWRDVAGLDVLLGVHDAFLNSAFLLPPGAVLFEINYEQLYLQARFDGDEEAPIYAGPAHSARARYVQVVLNREFALHRPHNEVVYPWMDISTDAFRVMIAHAFCRLGVAGFDNWPSHFTHIHNSSFNGTRLNRAFNVDRIQDKFSCPSKTLSKELSRVLHVHRMDDNATFWRQLSIMVGTPTAPASDLLLTTAPAKVDYQPSQLFTKTLFPLLRQSRDDRCGEPVSLGFGQMGKGCARSDINVSLFTSGRASRDNLIQQTLFSESINGRRVNSSNLNIDVRNCSSSMQPWTEALHRYLAYRARCMTATDESPSWDIDPNSNLLIANLAATHKMGGGFKLPLQTLKRRGAVVVVKRCDWMTGMPSAFPDEPGYTCDKCFCVTVR